MIVTVNLHQYLDRQKDDHFSVSKIDLNYHKNVCNFCSKKEFVAEISSANGISCTYIKNASISSPLCRAAMHTVSNRYIFVPKYNFETNLYNLQCPQWPQIASLTKNSLIDLQLS